MVKVSVIVPVYNAERYLKKCINSICNQTLKEIEIICIDDGSTDSSLKLLCEFARGDSRIQIVSQINQYAGVARNRGMELATGEYLSFLDADDCFEYDMLEKMYERAKKQDADVTICRYAEYDEKMKKSTFPDWKFIDSFFYNKEEFSGVLLKHSGIFQITRGWAWDKLFRTNFVRRINYKFPSFRSSEDGFFVYMIMARAKRLSYMDNIFVLHRINEVTSLSNTKEKNWINGFKMLLMIKAEMEKQNIYDMYKKSFLNEVVNFLIWYLKSMHSFEAYRSCYQYIKTDMEPQVKILNYDKKYFFYDHLYDCYRDIVALSLEEYLYLDNQKNLSLICRQGEVINKQDEVLKEKGWVFPYSLIEKDKVLVLYGAGKIGQNYYSQLIASQFCKKLIWVDKQYDKYVDTEDVVLSPEVIFQREFDYIFIAVRNKKIQEDVKNWLLGHGIEDERIRWFGGE